MKSLKKIEYMSLIGLLPRIQLAGGPNVFNPKKTKVLTKFDRGHDFDTSLSILIAECVNGLCW